MEKEEENSKFDEKHTLFTALKSIVERILSSHSFNVWSVHGGLASLVSAIDVIFKHGNKPHAGILGPVVDYWLFVRGLRWLEPTLAPDIDYLSKLPAVSPCKPQQAKARSIRPQVHLTHGQQWLEKCLKDQSLSRQFKVLISDQNHLSEHYNEWAYLNDVSFSTATLICIRALEQNSSILLAKISTPLLGRRRLRQNDNVRLHRAVTSLSDILPSSRKASLASNHVQRRPSPTENTRRGESDPLCVTTKPGLLANKLSVAKAVEHSQSFEDNLKFQVYESVVETPTSNMGMITSLSACAGIKDRFETDDVEDLHRRILPSKEGISSFKSTAVRKPLFYDSNDSDCDPDDLGFLASPLTNISPDEGQAKSYYFTVESHFSRSLNASNPISFKYSGSEVKPKPDSCCHPLPDVVTSAEVARAENLDVSKSKNLRNLAELSKCDFTTQNSLALDEESQISETRKELEVSGTEETRKKLTHRRCNSEQIVTSASYDCSNSIVNEVMDTHLELKSSNSLPSLSDDQPEIAAGDPVSSLKTLHKSHSLIDYLRNQDLATCADIDKENAHFHFSEMLICAIEQMKCRMHDQLYPASPPLSPNLSSTPRTSLSFSNPKVPSNESVFSYPHSEEFITPKNGFSPSESYCSPVGSFTSDLPSQASFYASDLPLGGRADTSRTCSEFHDRESTVADAKSGSEVLRTAESIAIGLLQTFSGQRHVTADEMDWLISEEDVPQKLLPFPNSMAVDPDPGIDHGIRIRGNQNWAPPRPQLILKAPVKQKLKATMLKQNYRCAGCGGLVEKAFMSRYRYCEYTGKYFCTCCHDNKLSVIPAFILYKFDFNKRKVSNFSYDWLNKISCEPLFNINDINPKLYHKNKVMFHIKELRMQLSALYKYLQVCNIAKTASGNNEESLITQVTSRFQPQMYQENVHSFSLDDLVAAKNGELFEDLKAAVEIASQHVISCQSCRMKGFICEFCDSKDIIFPHQASVSVCSQCRTCFHKRCYITLECPRCVRLRKRREMLRRISEE